MTSRLVPIALLALSLSGGCAAFDDDAPPTSTQTSTSQPGGDTVGSTDPVVSNSDAFGGDSGLVSHGVGEACQKTASGQSDCRIGLRCLDGLCQPVGDTPQNSFCTLSAECADGLYCGFSGRCEPSGEATEGQACSSPADCAPDLRCQIVGVAGVCAPGGEADMGDACQGHGDCFNGLLCNSQDVCGFGSFGIGFTPWAGRGPDCEGPDDGAPRPYFELPRGDGPVEFFRVPWPTDARMRGGVLDMTGFATPGRGLLDFDPVQRLLDALTADSAGFSTEPTAFFRFSTPIAFATVTSKTVRFVNVDPQSPQYGWGLSYGWTVTDGGGRYICPRYVAVRPAWSSPLLPGTTYAVILTNGITSNAGVPLARDADFDLMMAETAPTDPIELSAWEAHAKLRTFLADEEKAGELTDAAVVAAAVFTTRDVEALPAGLREAVHAADKPAPKGLTLCDGATTSPCDDGLTGDEHVRGCVGVSGDFYELHMRVPLPVFQKGTKPYLTPNDDGRLTTTSGGAPMVAGTEDVCVSLTIPKNVTMPDTGWPVMLYGHGTGGTFRSAVKDVAGPLAAIDVDGTSIGVATVGWEGPMHGERRGSELDPEVLFYNFGNPLAAQANVLQGVADIYALVRAFAGLEIKADDSPTGKALAFDASRVMLTGHSQGSSYGPIAAAFEPDLKLTVWSGAGGGLVLSLLNKTSPVNVPQGIAAALQEINGTEVVVLNDVHPVLGLMQMAFDVADPISFARRQVREPLEAVGAQHVLHIYGVTDTYTPVPTIQALAKALGLEHVAPVVTPFGLYADETGPTEAPVKGNKHNGTVTAGLVQYEADGYDGHFVLFREAAAMAQYTHFVGSFVADGVPTIIAP